MGSNTFEFRLTKTWIYITISEVNITSELLIVKSSANNGQPVSFVMIWLPEWALTQLNFIVIVISAFWIALSNSS